MIEFSGTIFGAPAMQMRVEPLDDDGNVATYAVKVVVRDPEGDHIFQRTITVPKFSANILGILQYALDELPVESQFCKGGVWSPRQDASTLELPSG